MSTILKNKIIHFIKTKNFLNATTNVRGDMYVKKQSRNIVFVYIYRERDERVNGHRRVVPVVLLGVMNGTEKRFHCEALVCIRFVFVN